MVFSLLPLKKLTPIVILLTQFIRRSESWGAGKVATTNDLVSTSFTVTFYLSPPVAPSNNNTIVYYPDDLTFQDTKPLIKSITTFSPKKNHILDWNKVDNNLEQTPSLHLNSGVQYIYLRIL